MDRVDILETQIEQLAQNQSHMLEAIEKLVKTDAETVRVLEKLVDKILGVELLKSLPIVAALTPAALAATINKDGTELPAKAYALEEGPWYLFVVGPQCDLDNMIDSFRGSKVRGCFVVARDGDVENYLRIYKLEE